MNIIEEYSRIAIVSDREDIRKFAEICGDGTDYRQGDIVVTVTEGKYDLCKIVRFLTSEEEAVVVQSIKVLTGVLGKVDVTAYEQRQEVSRRDELRRAMSNRKKELAFETAFELYAAADKLYSFWYKKFQDLKSWYESFLKDGIQCDKEVELGYKYLRLEVRKELLKRGQELKTKFTEDELYALADAEYSDLLREYTELEDSKQ